MQRAPDSDWLDNEEWEPPCQGLNILEQIKAQTGRPCPRVPLDEDNFDAWAVFCAALSPDLHALGPIVIHDLMAEMGEYEARAVRRRVAGAIQDRRVSELLHPKPKAKPERKKMGGK